MKECFNKKILNILNYQNLDLINFNLKSERIDKYLLENNLITEDKLLKIYHEIFNYEIIDLDKININEEVFKLFTYDFINKYHVIPIEINENVITIGINDPFNIVEFDKIKLFTNKMIIKYSLCKLEQINKVNNLIYSKETRITLLNDLNKNKEEKNDEFKNINNLTSSNVVKIVDSIIIEAINLLASDIHIEPFEKTVRIRNRIDGELNEPTYIDKEYHQGIISRIKVLAGIDISKTQIPHDGKIVYSYNNKKYDLRISTIPSINGEKIVIRILDKDANNFNLSNIGFNSQDLNDINKLINLPYGIILLTGPTGCGKSTTLYTFIKELNKKNLNIMAIEDPVEYNVTGVTQIQVNSKANMTFGNGLRSILRQDPNVIMVGEIRDEETARIAVRASLTGHLVFSTLHTNNAISSITRLIDMGIEPYLITDSLVAVINQRLIRKLCPYCKSKYLINEEEKQLLNIKEDLYLYQEKGCPACNNTGYKGRMMVYEILKVNKEFKNILGGIKTQDYHNIYKNNNFTSISDNTKQEVLNGNTTIKEFMKINHDNK